MSKSRKRSPWWSWRRARLRAPDRPAPPLPVDHGHYWTGAPVGDLLGDPASAQVAVDTVFATHPDLLGLDVLLDRIARIDP